MNAKKTMKIYLYTRFERSWHWLQALMIICLMVTGFEIHGTYTLLGFQTAVNIHNFVGLSWLILFAFFIFWLFVTGEWRQYIPTTKNCFAWGSTIAGIFSKAWNTLSKNVRVPSTTRCSGWHIWAYPPCCSRFRWLQDCCIICIMTCPDYFPCRSWR